MWDKDRISFVARHTFILCALALVEGLVMKAITPSLLNGMKISPWLDLLVTAPVAIVTVVLYKWLIINPGLKNRQNNKHS